MSELSDAINEMRNMRESYNQIGAAAEAYNAGKVELAENITAKGIPASATETLPELAEKVAQIAQETYDINGGDMYAKQLFGSLTTPNYWNLYEVLAQLLSDGRLVSYGGILLAEYYRGYDSLALAGAGAGGAYVVSDMEDGQFKMYTEDTTHTWATEFDGKGNRWVAYCFADEYHDFQITDTNTSPRSIFIGRKVGTITNLVDGRASQITVPSGLGELLNFNGNSKLQQFGKRLVLTNIKNANLNINVGEVTESLYLEAESIVGTVLAPHGHNLSSVIIKCDNISTPLFFSNFMAGLKNIRFLFLDVDSGVSAFGDPNASNIKDNLGMLILKANNLTFGNNANTKYNPNINVLLKYKDNIKTDKISLIGIQEWSLVECIEIEDGWNKLLDIHSCTALTEPNIYSHILQRLKQDEPDCGDGVTITLGQTNLDKLTSEESLALLDELTNTYGYTFA